MILKRDIIRKTLEDIAKIRKYKLYGFKDFLRILILKQYFQKAVKKNTFKYNMII